MAKIEGLAPIIAKWEGGFVNDATDKGGVTNMGVTIATWKQVGYDKNHDGHIDVADIKMLDKDDFKFVLKRYWNTWQADKIVNQSIANILVDWAWGSGKLSIVIPQRLLGLDDDGIVGNNTLTHLNNANQKQLFDSIFKARVKFLNDIVARNPSQSRFIKGWLNRLNDFKFLP